MITPLLRRLLLAIVILVAAVAGFQGVWERGSKRAAQRPPSFLPEPEEGVLFNQLNLDGLTPPGAREKAWRESMLAIAPQFQPDTPSDHWTSIGPAPINGGQIETPNPRRVTGRILDIAVDPTNPLMHWYIAADSGGIWETANGGLNWAPRTDGEFMLRMHTISLAPSNPQILFASTGDTSGNLLKSINGGASWTVLKSPAPQFENVGQRFYFAGLKVHPTDPQTVMIATWKGSLSNPPQNQADGGIFKSTNGGASFVQTLSGPATALAIDPTNFSQQYAGVRNESGTNPNNGVYRSMDGGEHWTELTNAPWEKSIQQPGRPVKIALARATTGIDEHEGPEWVTLYVVVPNGGIWRTRNAWDSEPIWEALPLDFPEGDPLTFPDVATTLVDPGDTNVFYIGGMYKRGFYRYSNGRWTSIYPTTHYDQRAMAAVRVGNTTTLLLGNDGGFWTSTNSGTNWDNKNANLATVQFYAGALHPANPNAALGGSQDNGTELWTGDPVWDFVWYGDGSHCLFSQTNPDLNWLILGNNEILKMTVLPGIGPSPTSAGPPNPDPLNPITRVGVTRRAPHSNVILSGGYKLWKSTDFFTSPTPWLTWWVNAPPATDPDVGPSAIAFAPSDPCSLTYAYGRNDGQLFLTQAGGDQPGEVPGPWTNLDPGGLVPTRPISAIAIHPTDPATIYVALGKFDEDSQGAPGHVFKTQNATSPSPVWENVTPRLPDHLPGSHLPVNLPMNALAIDPANPETIYVGTDLGVWRSNNGGALNSWTFMGPGSGMPNAIVTDLHFSADGHLVAFTYGRGAFRLNETTVYPTPPRLANISTRMDVGTKDNVLIGGFILTGPSCATKQIALRGLGSSTQLGGYLEDPFIELRRDDGSLVLSNDNWGEAPNLSEIPAYLRPADPNESVIVTSLSPGAYTLIVRSANGGSGIGLFEAYDLEPTSSLHLANVSTRGFVQTNDKVMIGGFVLVGANSMVLMRGLGPSLPPNVPDRLPDPLLELKNGNGVTLVMNDNWRDAPNAKDVENRGFGPGNDLESVILTTLPPGPYTVILSDVNRESGNGLFEAYRLDF